MNKKVALDMVRAARSAHIQWRARAQALVSGIPLNKDQVPVSYTDCKFGKWYYSEGQRLAALSSYKAVEEPHEQLHLIYMKIFNHLYGDDNRSGLSKLFGSKRKYKEKHRVAAEELLPNLIGVSSTVLEAIEYLEKDIQGMSDADFDSLNI